ncbi:MAG: hypothetical protein WCG91_00280 [Candidatus Shapirobacteria bacterium]
MKKEKRIPTILGLFLLLGSILSGVVLSNQKTSFKSSASGDCNPINPQVTNITNTSFNVSFITTANCLSNINIDNKTISDLRFINTGRKESATKVHYFEVNNLKEDTNYQFSLINNGQKFESQNYKGQTARKPSNSVPTSNLAWGRVFTPDLKPATDAIVYLNTVGASPLSAVVTSKGYWNISLATSFNEAKNNWFTPSSAQNEDFIVLSTESDATQITGNTSNNNPVPDIILGKNEFSPKPVTDYGNEQSGYLNSVPSFTNSDKSLTISNPKENEAIFTLKPDFFGSAPVSATLDIQVESENVIKDQVKSQPDGSWNWSPPKSLVPGEHTITITALNPKTNILEKITRKFIVVAADNSKPAFSASQSAKITTIPTPTITMVPTIIPTTAPTLVPTLKATPTIEEEIPTLKPTKISTASSMPATGVGFPTFILIGFSAILLVISYFVL